VRVSPTAAPRNARPSGESQLTRPTLASLSSTPTSVTDRLQSSSSISVTVAPKRTWAWSACRTGSTTVTAFIRLARWLARRSIARNF